MKRITLALFVASLALFVISLTTLSPGWAEDYDDFNRLIGAKSLRCVFNIGSSGNWEDGEAKVADTRHSGPIVFDAIDLDRGTARLITDLSSRNVAAEQDVTGVHFIARTPLGLALTSVFRSRTGQGEFVAVTSRHSHVGDRPLPSQFYGTCQILE